MVLGKVQKGICLMNDNASTRYDKRKIFDKDGRPLLEALSQFCRLNGIPFAFTCCVANNADESIYVNEIEGAEGRGIHLTDDRIARHLGLMMGLRPLGVPQEDLAIEEADDYGYGFDQFEYGVPEGIPGGLRLDDIM